MDTQSTMSTFSSLYKKSSTYNNMLKIKKEKDVMFREDQLPDFVRIKTEKSVDSDALEHNEEKRIEMTSVEDLSNTVCSDLPVPCVKIKKEKIELCDSEKNDEESCIKLSSVEQQVHSELSQETFSFSQQSEGIKLTNVFSGEDAGIVFDQAGQNDENMIYIQSPYDESENNFELFQNSQNSADFQVGSSVIENLTAAPESIGNLVTRDKFDPCSIMVTSVTSCANPIPIDTEMFDENVPVISGVDSGGPIEPSYIDTELNPSAECSSSDYKITMTLKTEPEDHELSSSYLQDIYNSSKIVDNSDPISSIKIVTVQSEAKNIEPFTSTENLAVETEKPSKPSTPESSYASFHDMLFNGPTPQSSSIGGLFTNDLRSTSKPDGGLRSKSVSFEKDSLPTINLDSLVKAALEGVTMSNTAESSSSVNTNFQPSSFSKTPTTVPFDDDDDIVIIEEKTCEKQKTQKSVDSNHSKSADKTIPEVMYVNKPSTPQKQTISPQVSSPKQRNQMRSSDKHITSVEDDIIVLEVKSSKNLTKSKPIAKSSSEISAVKKILTPSKSPPKISPPKKISTASTSPSPVFKSLPIPKDSSEFKNFFPLCKDMVIVPIPDKSGSSSKKRKKKVPKIQELYKRPGLSITSLNGREEEEEDEEIVFLEEVPSRKKKKSKKTRSSRDCSPFMRQSMVHETVEIVPTVVDCQGMALLNHLCDVVDLCKDLVVENVDDVLSGITLPGIEINLVSNENGTSEKIGCGEMKNAVIILNNRSQICQNEEDSVNQLIISGNVLESIVQTVSLNCHNSDLDLASKERLIASETVLENVLQEVSWNDSRSNQEQSMTDQLFFIIKAKLENVIQQVTSTNLKFEKNQSTTETSVISDGFIVASCNQTSEEECITDCSSVSKIILEDIVEQISMNEKTDQDCAINVEAKQVLNSIITSVENTQIVMTGSSERSFSEVKQNLSSGVILSFAEVDKENTFKSKGGLNTNKRHIADEKETAKIRKMKPNKSLVSKCLKKRLTSQLSADPLPLINANLCVKPSHLNSKIVSHSSEKMLPHKIIPCKESTMKITCRSNILNLNSNIPYMPSDSTKKGFSIHSPSKSTMNSKRKNAEFGNSVPKLLKLSNPQSIPSNIHPSHFKNKSSPSKFHSIQSSPKKSKLLSKNFYSISKRKSPYKSSFRRSPKKPLFSPRKNYRRHLVLSKTGLSLPRFLREKLIPSSTETNSNSITILNERSTNSDSDSEIEILYTDPKTYSDSDCMIVYESEEQIVLD